MPAKDNTSVNNQPIYGTNKITQPSTAPPQPPVTAPRSKVLFMPGFRISQFTQKKIFF